MGDVTTAAAIMGGAVAVAKPVVETACKLMADLLGKPCKIAGNMLADQVYSWQWTNRIKIAHRAKEIMTQDRVAEAVLPSGFLLPLLDKGGNVEDPELQEMWAHLLASAVADPGARHPVYVIILSQLSRNEAVLLSNSERHFRLSRCKTEDDHQRLLAWVRERAPEAIETYIGEREIEFCRHHLNALGVADLQTVTCGHLNCYFNQVSERAEMRAPRPETTIEYYVDELVCKPTPLGHILLSACGVLLKE